MIYQNQTPGLLPSEAERLGKITVGTELGWGRAVNPEGVRYGRQGVLAALINNGLLHGSIEPIAHHRAGTQRKLEMVDRDCFIPAPFAGHYEPLVECGTAVRKGQTVGLLHDFDQFDLEPYPCVAAGRSGAGAGLGSSGAQRPAHCGGCKGRHLKTPGKIPKNSL